MLKERRDAVRSVTELLVELEDKVDAVMKTRSQLEGALIDARRSAKLPLTAGLDGMDRLARATVALTAARRDINEAHYDFRQVRDENRLPVHAYGDTGDTPRPPQEGSARPDLTVVAA